MTQKASEGASGARAEGAAAAAHAGTQARLPGPTPSARGLPFREIGVDDLAARLEAGLADTILDVRTLPEVAGSHIPGALAIPMHELPQRHAELAARPGPIFVTCEHGVRSVRSCQYLHGLGYDVVNILEGMHLWPGPRSRGPA